MFPAVRSRGCLLRRAVAKHPEVYIFDDSFSALDYKTDVALRRALKQKTAGQYGHHCRTAESVRFYMQNKFLFWMKGKIAGMGTHQELLKNCEVYRQIAASQLSEEELKAGRQWKGGGLVMSKGMGPGKMRGGMPWREGKRLQRYIKKADKIHERI